MLQHKQADHQLELSKMKLQGRALQNLGDFRTICSVSPLIFISMFVFHTLLSSVWALDSPE